MDGCNVSYANLIFGNTFEVKKLLVREISEARFQAMISHDELEQVILFNDEWPSLSEIESNPALLTHAFIQEVLWLDDPLTDKIGPAFCGIATIQPIIRDYLARHPDILEQACRSAAQEIKPVHGTSYGPDPETALDRMLRGEHKEVHPNSESREDYAATYVYTSIMHELDEKVVI